MKHVMKKPAIRVVHGEALCQTSVEHVDKYQKHKESKHAGEKEVNEATGPTVCKQSALLG